MMPYICFTFHISFRQGTWKFMAADLVERSDIPQTFVHDLESFFWVLLWVVLTRVKTSWTEEQVSNFINGTMNPKVYADYGGWAKVWFLTSKDELSENHFKIPGNPILREFLKGLHSLVAVRHRGPPSMRDNPFLAENLDPDRKPITQEEHERAVKEHKEALKHLRDN